MSSIQQSVNVPASPSQKKIESCVQRAEKGAQRPDGKRVEVPGFRTRDERLGNTSGCSQVHLAPSTTTPQCAQNKSEASIIHSQQDADSRLSVTYPAILQPLSVSLCYPDVCMDDLTARLATDLDGAFGDFVREHQDLVFGVALRVVSDRASAEDVAQEAFVKAYRALKRFPPERTRALQARPWLARITLNTGRSHLKTRRAHTDIADVAAAIPTTDAGPAHIAERRHEQRTWARLLAALPDRYRLAVALRHVDGLSYEELAETLNKPVGTCKSDVHRGVSLLRAAYYAEQRVVAQKEAV